MTKPALRPLGFAVLAALALTGCSTTGSSRSPLAEDYAAALADPKRPEADRSRDAARKPGELLAFAQVRTGQQVGDFVMGGGYFTRILAAAVGPGGKVHAFQPGEFIAFRKQYAADQEGVVAAFTNVVAVGGSISAPRFTVPLDAIVTVQNFHDMYLKPFPADFGTKGSAALFAALKPGGVLVVVDHSAAAGSGTSQADSLHRIDRQAVVEALTKTGFKLEAESALYADPADSRTTNVFSPAIRGKTDQFALRFRKPRK
jgi:predicted methyltransferase